MLFLPLLFVLSMLLAKCVAYSGRQKRDSQLDPQNSMFVLFGTEEMFHNSTLKCWAVNNPLINCFKQIETKDSGGFGENKS